MDIHTILLRLTMCPWSSARNLVELTGLGVSSINRALDDYYNLGWVVSRMIGRGSRATRLWILASEFLELYYAVDHVHGHAGGPDGHRHHPLHPGLVNHKHIPWHLRAAGVRRLYSRLEPHLYFYEIRDRLFREAGQALLRYADGGTPVLKSWEPIRRGQLAEVVAIYENEHAQFVIVFCWLGKQLKIGRMLEKWYYRFSNLRGTSRARQMVRHHNILDPPDSPPDEDFNDTPQPSLYVMVGQDEYIVRRAMDLIPTKGYLHENAFSWWVGGNPCRKIAESGIAWPDADYVYEDFEDLHIGEPEGEVPAGPDGRDGYPAPAVLSLVLPYRILCLAGEWAAICEEDAEDLFGVEDGSVPAAFDALVLNQGQGEMRI